MRLHLFHMFHTGVLLPDEHLKTQLWCPCDCPTPYPHSLTSISLLVSPQQIRKASQHLHGDRPQSSRWPQCAARQLKRERRAGKRKWVRIRGEQGRQREAASASGLRTNVCTCALADTHTRCVHASVHSSGSSQRKQIPTPRQSRSISSVRVSRGVRATGEVQRATNCPRISHTQSLHRWAVREASNTITRANPTNQSIGLTF